MPNLTLRELDAKFLRIVEHDPADAERRTTYYYQESLADAHGVQFLCPKCWQKNGGPVGTHAVRCWAPGVSQDHGPSGGRWPMTGTSLADLTLSPSVGIVGGCAAHFFVRDGAIADLT